ncbi:hypothetical protein ACHAXT_006212 [Thalassiosira profunda]
MASKSKKAKNAESDAPSSTSAWYYFLAILPLPLLVLSSNFLRTIISSPPSDHGSGSMFDLIATRYDFINRALALNLDMSWRHRLVEEVVGAEGEIFAKRDGDEPAKILDLATGTADVAILLGKAAARYNAPSASSADDSIVLGLDPSQNMLDVGKTKVQTADLSSIVRLELGDARKLDALQDNTFNAATMSFGIRNVPEKELALCEIHRVLKKGSNLPLESKLAIMEFSEPGPDSGVMGSLARLFIRHVVPAIGAMLSGFPKEYMHLQKSIKDFPSPPEFVALMEGLKCPIKGGEDGEELEIDTFGSFRVKEVSNRCNMEPPPVDAEEVYEYYAHNLLPALFSSLPILLSRLARDLWFYVTRFIQFLFPIWFRRWTVDTTDTLARAARDVASEGGDFLSHIWSSNATAGKGNSTVVDFILEKMDLNNDGHITRKEWTVNAEEMAKDLEALMEKYYHAVSDSLQSPQQTSWYAWLRKTVGSIIAVDWSMGSYLWHTCSGLILVLIVTSIIPGRLHGWTGRALRFPVLGMTYLLISVELVLYTLIRFAIRGLEGIFATPKHRAARRGMAQAKSYEEWYEIAKKLDESQGREKWRNTTNDGTAYRYSWPFILELLSDLKAARENNDIMMALAVLQQCTRKNVGGIMSDDLFSFTNCGEPKKVVTEFIDEVVTTLQWVTEEVRSRSQPPPGVVPEFAHDSSAKEFDKELKSKAEEEQNKMLSHMLSWATLGILGSKDEDEEGQGSDNVPSEAAVSGLRQISKEEYARNLVLREKIKTFLKRARAAYGRTALCLSGGAMMGNYHFGAIKALLESDMLPHIISGTSAGSVIGAMLCTRTDEELMRDLTPEVLAPKMSIFESSWGQRLTRWYRHGTMFDQEDWHRRVKFFTCGDMTFEEAYKKTGRVFCVTLSAASKKAPPVLINYITAPTVTIASAVLASAAVPGFIDAMRLQVKDEDGVIRDQSKNAEEYRDGSIDSDIPTTGLAELLNCKFFLAAQANPHIVPFFFEAKGDVGQPSRWSSGMRDDSWRGGFLLAALEMYLKNDMRSKFHFINDLEVAVGFTSTMMTQTYSGTTTIVPSVCLKDFFLLFGDQSVDDMARYFQGGAVAAFQHMAFLKHHYKIAHALDECLACLEYDEAPNDLRRRRRSQLLHKRNSMKATSSSGGLHFAKLGKDQEGALPPSETTSSASSVSNSGYASDDEYEKGGFDGVDVAFGPGRRSFADNE